MSAIFSFSNFCATIGRMGKGLGQIHACRLNFRVSFRLPAHMEDETAALESVEAEEEWGPCNPVVSSRFQCPRLHDRTNMERKRLQKSNGLRTAIGRIA